jgi:hypothetical protein
MYDTNTGYLIYIAATGLMLGLIFLLVWIVRRITWLLRLFSSKAVTAPNFSKAIRNLVLSVLWIAIFGMLLFYGFFFSAYNSFTLEEAVAQIKVEKLPAPQMSRIELTQYVDGKAKVEKFVIKGDQWMLEGDLSAAIKMRVQIQHAADGGGEMRIRYKDLDDLDRLCRKLGE